MAKRSYFQDIVSVLGSNLAVTLSNIITGIILSRVLGAAGYGLYSSILVVPIIVVGFTQLGIRRSLIYHLGNKSIPERNIYSAVFLLLLYTSALSIIICGAVFFFSDSLLVDPLIVGIVLLTIPLLLTNVFAGGIFLGKEQILRANIINAGPSLLTLVFTILFVWILRFSVLGAFLAISISNIFMVYFVYYIFSHDFKLKIIWKYQEGTIKMLVRLGIVNAVAIFIMQLNYRMDVLMLKKLSTLEQTGYYSLAMQIAEQLWHVPYAIETIILSRSANTNDDQFVHKTVASIFRISLIIGLIGCATLFFLAPWVVPLVFGKAYTDSVLMIQTVLPGIFLMMGFRILNSRLTGMGKPQVAIFTFLPALMINFIANLFLIPKFGGVGAAWATNISYAAGSLAFLFVYSRLTKMPVAELFRYRQSDFYFLRDFRHFRIKRKNSSSASAE
ncbi:MAG TPA: flippase [Bacteroidales bacterium]|nr:flippase [Bacteroidales bacterium]